MALGALETFSMFMQTLWTADHIVSIEAERLARERAKDEETA
jgi:hypothetical protein